MCYFDGSKIEFGKIINNYTLFMLRVTLADGWWGAKSIAMNEADLFVATLAFFTLITIQQLM